MAIAIFVALTILIFGLYMVVSVVTCLAIHDPSRVG